MNREEGVVKGQVGEGEVMRSKPGGVEEFSESAPGNELNPFLVEPVLVKLLKLVEEVSQLKELRKMCQTWDEFNLKEIEDRAFNGKVKAVDFLNLSTDKFTSESEANFHQFMEDTSAIPRVFSSFKFNFPESWTILQNHMEFFSIYPMTFFHLAISWHLTGKKETWVLFTKFLDSEICANLKEITIDENGIIYRDEIEEFVGFPDISLFVPSENRAHKLQKLDMNVGLIPAKTFETFQSAFASGKFAHLTSLGIAKLESGNLDISGLDLTKLTRLEIMYIGDDFGTRRFASALEFISGLINLARNGMKLKNLGMFLPLAPDPGMDLGESTYYYRYFNNLRLSCSNLTQFFSSQSSTLETLIVKIYCYMDYRVDLPEGADTWCKIHLPQFEALHTLDLENHFKLIEDSRKTHTKLFEMAHSLPHHFPKLVNLTLNFENSLISLKVNPALDEVDQLHLECLEIIDWGGSAWSTSFEGVIGSVKELKCPPNLLRINGDRLPWAESLRSLSIDMHSSSYRDERMNFKLDHLKKLEKLIIEYFAINNQLNLGGPPLMEVDEFLNNFKWATELPLTSITFKGPKVVGEETKEQFIKYFPYPVKFKIFR